MKKFQAGRTGVGTSSERADAEPEEVPRGLRPPRAAEAGLPGRVRPMHLQGRPGHGLASGGTRRRDEKDYARPSETPTPTPRSRDNSCCRPVIALCTGVRRVPMEMAA